MTTRISGMILLVCAGLLWVGTVGASGPADVQGSSRDSGIQFTPTTDSAALVNKNVGEGTSAESRWAITRTSSGVVTGVVYLLSGDTQFAYCTPTGEDETTYEYSCQFAYGCVASPCDVTEPWGDPVDASLPKSFFEPPAGAVAANRASVLSANLRAATAGSGGRDSAIQFPPGGELVLVNKVLPDGSRWAILRNLATLVVTGNVYSPGAEPAFLYCEQESSSPTQLVFGCRTSTKCTSTTCPAWVALDSTVPLPPDFFEPPEDQIDSTNVTDGLNARIAANEDQSVYTGGKGILFRDLNDGFTSGSAGVQVDPKVVPGTLIVNDIFTPNIVYTTEYDGRAVAGVVYEEGSLDALFGSNLQGPARGTDPGVVYNSGVFYASDANATDKRCRWEASDNRWDCRGIDVNEYVSQARGYIDPDTLNFTPSSTAVGTSGFDMGNPYEGGGGGGTGPHMNWDSNTTWIDQDWACDGNGVCLTKRGDKGDAECNAPAFVESSDCNEYAYSGFEGGDGNCWDRWIDHYRDHRYFGSGENGANVNLRDLAICWNYNPRDMINLQNWFWLNRADWTIDTEAETYWGWNEVPISASYAQNTAVIEAIGIILPVGTYYARDLPQKQALDDSLEWYVQNGFLVPGVENITNRPGSYVVLARQWEDSDGNYQRYFFCEDLELEKYKVVYVPPGSDNPTGACYLDLM